jgi:transcriptional regulator with GAF, ATPase, and Fis domain
MVEIPSYTAESTNCCDLGEYRLVTLELQAWRIMGRKLDVSESFRELGPILVHALAARALLLLRFEPDRLRADLVAHALAEGEKHAPISGPIELGADALADAVTWCKDDRVLRAKKRDEHPILKHLTPRGMHGPFLIAALSKAGETLGAVLAQGRSAFTPAHEDTIRNVREPLAVALENDRRVHELMRLREAMEADKQALLARLDRQEIADSVVGAETGLREVLARVEQVAPTDTPVLILGETGSGKEVVARAIHAKSPRARGPMVRVNCGAIPSELVDSELFGHERGSFTGAVHTRKGWFERADGGTLFLDEIGELPLAAQVRLLRVIQDGVVERVGGERSVKADVRIVTATHQDLDSMVARGEFRQDLLYRIGVFPLRLPPLRERLEDVPSLAAHFALRACKRLGVPPLALTPDDITQLVSYSWPGNVRELAAVIERATILGDGRRLAIAQALGTGVRASPLTQRPAPASSTLAAAPKSETDTLNAAMATHIQQALERSHGRVEGPFGAARTLGLHPNTLRARMRKLGIDWRRFRDYAG